ncbi:MAG: hypothetical protein SGBAC_009355 [Bacillariaceae sp.]
MKRSIALTLIAGAISAEALLPSQNPRSQLVNTLKSTVVEQKEAGVEESESKNNKPRSRSSSEFWRITSSTFHPQQRPLTSDLIEAMEMNTHPKESQEELGQGLSIESDWRENWYTYESPADDPDLIDDATGYSEYECEVEGNLPDELQGTLYRNGPGKFGVNGERVQHVLDADALVYKIDFPAPDTSGERKVKFLSRFVSTPQFEAEQKANKFLYRGTFGTGPSFEGLDSREKNGLNTDPEEPSILSKVVGGAFNTDIKNSANTQIISFGGKVLALFEAGLPFSLDPTTLETIGEDTMGGALKAALPVKLGKDMQDLEPDFLGGSAHTAHPQQCPKGNLVGWAWSQLPMSKSLEVTFTEWAEENFDPLTSSTFEIPNCSLAPHDMAMTENSIIFMINALEMNQLPFLLNLKGPAGSLDMDGRKNVKAWIFPRPSSQNQFEPFVVDVPACFSIHFSHGYEDEKTGNLVTFFSGWPPSDSKDFLGAWGGFCPEFRQIPPTFLWRLEIDPKEKRTVSLDIAPGCQNICTEHMLVHPNFITKKCENVYGTASNVIGDSTPPNGYVRLKVESGSTEKLQPGEPNEDVDVYWFGTRYFVTEPIIVPKDGGDPYDEDAAFLLGIVRDAAKEKNFLAVFDLEKGLHEGPVAKIWLRSGVPHGIHGCFSKDSNGGPSVFC